MHIYFSASDHDEAKQRFAALTTRYGQTPLDAATHIVVLEVNRWDSIFR